MLNIKRCIRDDILLRAFADNNNKNNTDTDSSTTTSSRNNNNSTPITLYANERRQQQQQHEERRHHRHEQQQLEVRQPQQQHHHQWRKQEQCELGYENDANMDERVTVICRCCLLEEDESPANYLPLDTVAAFIAADTTKPTTPNIGKDDDSSKQQTITTTTTTNTTTSRQQTPTLLDCLNMCAHIGASPSDENLPQHICLDCSQALEACCEFIRCVQNADKILRGKLRKQTTMTFAEKVSAFSQDSEYGSSTNFQREHLLSPPTSIPTSPRSDRTDPVSAVAVCNLFEENAKGCLREVTQKQGGGAFLCANTEIFNANATASEREANDVDDDSGDDDGIIEQYSDEDLASEHETLIEALTQSVDTEVESASSVVRSFDSGIEIDDDPYSLLPVHRVEHQPKPQPLNHHHYPQKAHPVQERHQAIHSDYTNETERTAEQQLYMASYRNTTFVVPSSLGQRLQQFHSSSTNTTMLKCGFCVHACRTQEQMARHMEKHMGPSRYNCNMCNFRCRFRYYLRKHKQSEHGVYESLYADLTTVIDRHTLLRTTTYSQAYTKYQCSTCKHYLTNLESLQQHIEMHKVELYECTICPYNDIIRENVLEHLAAEHKVLVEVNVVAQYIPLKNPLQSIHGYRNRNIPERAKQLPLDSLPRLTAKIKKHGKHLCQFCGKCFERAFHLMKHEYKVHNIAVDHDGLKSKFVKKSSPKHAQLQYQRHRKAAQSERRFHCYQCRKIFKTASILMQHRQSVHGQNVKFECDICGAEFMFNFELKYHRRTHEVKEQQQQQQHQHQTVSQKLFVGGVRRTCSESSETAERKSNKLCCGNAGRPSVAVFASSPARPLQTVPETSQDFSATAANSMLMEVAAEQPPSILMATTSVAATSIIDSTTQNSTNLTAISPLPSSMESDPASHISSHNVPMEASTVVAPAQQTPQTSLPMQTDPCVPPLQAEPPCLSFDLFDDSQLYLNDFDLDLLVC